MRGDGQFGPRIFKCALFLQEIGLALASSLILLFNKIDELHRVETQHDGCDREKAIAGRIDVLAMRQVKRQQNESRHRKQRQTDIGSRAESGTHQSGVDHRTHQKRQGKYLRAVQRDQPPGDCDHGRNRSALHAAGKNCNYFH